jgi:hypothetical protein
VFEQPKTKAASTTAVAEEAFWMFGQRFMFRPFRVMENCLHHVAAG